MNIIFPLISIFLKILRSGFLQIDGYGASEMAKLIGCLQPGKHPKIILVQNNNRTK